MTTLRTRDVLQQAHAFHDRLSLHYAELSENSADERLRLLCNYLSEHEHQLAHALTRYMHDASVHLLDAWLQNVPDERAFNACAVLSLAGGAEEVMTSAQHYDDCLMQMYAAMHDAAGQEDVRGMFANLIAMEEQEKHRVSLNMQTLYDW
ncbi:MAG: hypothetical protein ACRERR_12660 [Moraxellaceae bacterium]